MSELSNTINRYSTTQDKLADILGKIDSLNVQCFIGIFIANLKVCEWVGFSLYIMVQTHIY